MAAFIVITLGLALVVELAVIVSCIQARIPIGRGFGLCILAQVIIPVLLIAGFQIWKFVDPPARGLEGFASEGYARSLDFIGTAFWTVLLTTVIAGLGGGIRWMTRQKK